MKGKEETKKKTEKGMEKETMEPGEHLAILTRAMKMLFSLNHAYVLCIMFKSFLTYAIPYVPIYFAAALLDAILGGARVERIIWYAGLTVGLTFLLNLFLTWITAAREVEEEKLYRERDWMFSEKGMGMEYACTEDRDVALLLARIRQESSSGYNPSITWNLRMFRFAIRTPGVMRCAM